MKKLMIGFAALALFAVGCESKTAEIQSRDELPSAYGGGPSALDEKNDLKADDKALDEKTNADGTVKTGETDKPNGEIQADPQHGAESLAGGGAKTGQGATGKSMIETKDGGK